MARKKRTQLTDQAKKFLLDEMCKGKALKHICRDNPDIVPVYETVIRQGGGLDVEFTKQLSDAYMVQMFLLYDEIMDLSNKDPLELYPNSVNWQHGESILKRRIDVIKFALAKMAPHLSKRFDKNQEITLKVDAPQDTQVFAINYYDTPKQLELRAEKEINPKIED